MVSSPVVLGITPPALRLTPSSGAVVPTTTVSVSPPLQPGQLLFVKPAQFEVLPDVN